MLWCNKLRRENCVSTSSSVLENPNKNAHMRVQLYYSYLTFCTTSNYLCHDYIYILYYIYIILYYILYILYYILYLIGRQLGCEKWSSYTIGPDMVLTIKSASSPRSNLVISRMSRLSLSISGWWTDIFTTCLSDVANSPMILEADRSRARLRGNIRVHVLVSPWNLIRSSVCIHIYIHKDTFNGTISLALDNNNACCACSILIEWLY